MHSRSRSRSVSPIRLTLKPPDYQHKKFAYKTHNDRPEETIPYRPRYLSNRISEGSRSLYTSDSDTESHLSITSHRHSSKSKHSRIEIVEYRKKSSKTKRNKKHKKNKGSDDLVISDNDLDITTHHHKHKKHKSTGEEKKRKSQSDEHISYGSHKKSKHKSKKKKHKEKKHKEDKSKGDKNGSVGMVFNKSFIYTSDSEPDSVSDDVQIDSEKEVYDPVQNSSTFRPSGVEFVEVDAAQAAVIDQELDNINKTLANNDYISSLLKDSFIDSGNKTEEVPNTDPNRMVNPNEIFNQRSFKKHPYGHKKSGKSQNSATIQGRESNLSSEPLLSAMIDGPPKQEDSIQSHDITSCSDIDSNRQLPSFLTFSNLNSNFLNTFQNESTLFNCPESRKRFPNETPAYESPTSTGLFSCRDVTDKDNETVDVDGLSDDSDVDITGVTVPSEPVSVISYKTSNDSIKIGTSKDYIDVVGDSNEEKSDEEDKDIDKSHEEVNSNIQQERNSPDKNDSTYISDIDVENDDSDIECSLVEGHKTFEIDGDSENDREKSNDISDIDITGCSDDEVMIDADDEGDEHTKNLKNSDVNILNLDTTSETDLGCSDDEVMIDADDEKDEPIENIKNNDVNTLNLDTNSETDLDYNCEDFNSALSSADSKSESDTDMYGESEENAEANTNPETILENNSEHFVAEQVGISLMERSSDNKACTSCEKGPSPNEDANLNADQNLQDCLINEETVDDFLDVTTTVQPLAVTSLSSNPGLTDVSNSGGFRLTSNPVYETRPLSVPDVVDVTRVFSRRDRSTPEQEYIINIPRECDSPDSLSPRSSPELQVSPDLRDRHFDDEDFLPED